MEWSKARPDGETGREQKHRQGERQGRGAARQHLADRRQVGVARRRVDERQAEQDQPARHAADEEEPEPEIRPAQRHHHDGRRGGELEPRPESEHIAGRRGDHHAERRQQRHRQADVEGVLRRPIGRREGDRRRQQRRRLGEQGKPILDERAAEIRGQGCARPELDAEGDKQDERRHLGQVSARCPGHPAKATCQEHDDGQADHERLWNEDRVPHCAAPGGTAGGV